MIKLILGIILFVIIFFWLWLHWGKRGVYVAMTVSYETIKRGWQRENPNITEKELLIKTLQSRMTYKNRSITELEKIVEENSDIYSLIKFVIKNEGVKSWKEYSS
ncbi:MAG: hypothetical protein ABH896_01585 [Candidatus Jacksonbacteria bacterium]